MKKELYGFAVISKCALADIGGELYTMRHKRCGATLYFLRREDQNMTFAIGFSTPPYDNTGVFHILEHSVLCGSRKFPLKDPFVELLKGSVNTFLNAMTYPDMTVYPVSSQNKQDFLNLIDVYMDAVLHPNMLTRKEIFMQEGFHLCLDEQGALSYNGVVYNEMKGAYSSAEELLSELIKRQLYKDTPYAYDSGGDPEAIPTLTYEQFVEAHKTYYHPSGAYIVLDGDVDLDAVLPLLDEYLSEYEKSQVNAKISLQNPQFVPTLRREYELPADEALEGRVRYAMGFGGFSHDERERLSAFSILSGYLVGTNESPLKKALLDRGLCEDVYFSTITNTAAPRVALLFQNTREEELPHLYATVREVIGQELSRGLSRERLAAGLSRMEFALREADFGSYPKGLIYALRVLEGVMYGADAAELLSHEEMLRHLREYLDTGYYEDLLRELFIDGKMYTDVILVPSHTKAAEDAAALSAELVARRRSMSPEQLEQVRADEARLVAWQSTPDTPEALATVPTLSISDIDPLPKARPLTRYSVGECEVLHFARKTGGITYLQLSFNVSDLTAEELGRLSLLLTLLTHVDTECRDALSLRTEIQTKLGAIAPSVAAVSREGVSDKATAYVQINASVLDRNKAALPALLSEILTGSRFHRREQIYSLLKQHRIALEEFIHDGGYTPALFYAEGAISTEMSVYDHTEGYSAYTCIKALEKSFDTAWETLPEELTALARRIFTRDRLTLGLISDEYDERFSRMLLCAFSEDGVTPPESITFSPDPSPAKEIKIPGTVSHAVRAMNLADGCTGHMLVAKNLLSYEYLWNEIRVSGGAYGAGFSVQKNGLAFFYSYRDPNPSGADAAFLRAPDALRALAGGGALEEKHIIGAISAGEPYLTPKSEGMLALSEYFRGITYEQRAARRAEILRTTKDELLTAADALERALCRSVPCVMRGGAR